MSSTVKLIDKSTNTVLFTCSIEEIEAAYKQAESYEQMGLDIDLIAPSAPETLIRSLGANGQDIDTLKDVLNDEIKSHIEEEVGCVICPPKKI